MPRIENDIKLDFKDVLLRPKRSTLKSRSEVKHSLYYMYYCSWMPFAQSDLFSATPHLSSFYGTLNYQNM